MNYARLGQRFPEEAERRRVVENLVALREQLDGEVPPKDAEDNLLLATWNLRDLGKPVNLRRGYGDRIPESLFYIAEVLSRFDFVAVQEVNDLAQWDEIVGLLGPSWDYIATDETDRALGGNGERLTYAFDTRKVSFRNIAGELVLPPKLLITTNVEETASDDDSTVTVGDEEVGKQFARTPFTASFQSAWFKFDICTVHIYYGEESGEKLRRRIGEIRTVASYFGERAERALEESKSLILLGDFNVVDPEHETMKALLESGFEVPEALRGEASNIDRDKFYDQIAFKAKPGLLEPLSGDGGDAYAGVVEIFERIFTPEQFPDYQAAAASTPNGEGKSGDDLEDYYLDWRTYQFSDHNPMWVRLKVNDSAAYLEQLQSG